MMIYRNGDRCPCCGTVLQDKSREWLLEFSATVWALGFREEETAGGASSSPTGADADREAGPGPKRTPEDGRRICRR